LSGKEDIGDIKEILVNQKAKMFKEYIDNMRNKEKLNSIPLAELEKTEAAEVKVKTGTVVDEIIDGGIPEGKSVLFYGEYRSGKTQTCITMAVTCPDWVIYIDPEKSLRISRIKSMCEARKLDWAKVRDKIIYYRPKNWIEQMNVINSLPAPSDINGKVGLIICDSISKLFRGVEFLGRETLQVKNGLIREFMLALEQVADLHKAALVYTTQIYDSPAASGYPQAKSEMQKPVGGRSAEHQPDFILFFKKATGNIRIVEMVDSSYTPLAERAFVINEKGIDNLPPESKAAKSLEERSKDFAKKQSQENVKPVKKRKKGEPITEGEEEETEETTEETPQEEKTEGQPQQ
jgi:RecA/RadA recombinase